ncbi:hypothetical protein F9U64_10485 [Gracilibacillus oryzae]|uniref:Uncharacterized protein n=1 Tax=Gracilibacillus oryzae TaxID=1672701 RepID=A0A7C8L3G5_9BACI|nr:hypothetical protein [Gracilibacillus oryzae]KAB8135698.1 hypothetical protein F9U64_10485 [Gracilibacillus oryzae]
MQEKINVWSFIFSFFCIFLFAIYSFTGWFSHAPYGVHPLVIILVMTIITFLFGVFGFSGVRGWKGMTRSVVTIV